MQRRPKRYDADLPAMLKEYNRLLAWVILVGLWLSASPNITVAAELAVPMMAGTVAGQTASPAGEPVESAESWLAVDEAVRRATFLPDDLRWQAPNPSATELLPETAGIEAEADRFLAGLEEQRPFWGIYFRSDAAQDLDSGDTDVIYRLEWDLFKNGRYERKKDLEKKHHQNELQTLQLLNDVNLHRLNEQLDGIEFLAQAVQYHQARELAALLADILRRRRVQLEKGYITRDDFDSIRFKYRQTELKKKLYDTGRKAALDASLYDLLNCVEFADLIALDQAQQAAIEHAIALKIQHNLIERARYTRSWADDLSLNLYLERRDDVNDSSRSNVGVEVKVPIHWDTKREPLMDREKRLHEKKAAVLTRRIMTNLEKLYDFFAFQQVRIQMLLLELEKSAQRKAYEQMRAQRVLEDLDHTPERSLDQIRMEEIDLRYEAVQTRLKLYEILVKIAALIHADHPRDLIAGTQRHCPVR